MAADIWPRGAKEAGVAELFPGYLTQFYLGPPGSGAPWHYHTTAINTLAYGRKRWFLTPPELSQYSTQHPAAWFEQEYAQADAKPLECIQEAGDLLVVPSMW
eukprot:CAMPEP_0181235034 /NCGR_PEP_ID=MMETSP1096-20121128/37336_1 /TAXON_ID=156174 ORGANISM="Chrysochromulina ericina, Strain CCMP281" /NCGR_SAMPLE_ID=MMETSP1096 /ASSEMBLY_ACC=CAM_ASM_000453 /LENGTH=101 /DNA_ID=CAMNT_0023329939 /DNA_START=18 /DNA_END=320 /DNA_ORIENTATION=-